MAWDEDHRPQTLIHRPPQKTETADYARNAQYCKTYFGLSEVSDMHREVRDLIAWVVELLIREVLVERVQEEIVALDIEVEDVTVDKELQR